MTVLDTSFYNIVQTILFQIDCLSNHQIQYLILNANTVRLFCTIYDFWQNNPSETVLGFHSHVRRCFFNSVVKMHLVGLIWVSLECHEIQSAVGSRPKQKRKAKRPNHPKHPLSPTYPEVQNIEKKPKIICIKRVESKR